MLQKIGCQSNSHVTKFLMELGAGFSYLGKQYRFEVSGDEFFIDLLFYHVKLHCYLIIKHKQLIRRYGLYTSRSREEEKDHVVRLAPGGGGRSAQCPQGLQSKPKGSLLCS